MKMRGRERLKGKLQECLPTSKRGERKSVDELSQ